MNSKKTKGSVKDEQQHHPRLGMVIRCDKCPRFRNIIATWWTLALLIIYLDIPSTTVNHWDVQLVTYNTKPGFINHKHLFSHKFGR